uniref:Uncharacterized protein n=1 Tax=Aegilops tauschii subsp. strangulata TaxID=200361 RepID=A0A453Q666_AEGTS
MQGAVLLSKGTNGHQPSGCMFTSTKHRPCELIPKMTRSEHVTWALYRMALQLQIHPHCVHCLWRTYIYKEGFMLEY